MKRALIAVLIISVAAGWLVRDVSAQAAPAYAKWGAIAVKETQKRYEADIIDYKHIGRSHLSESLAEERFKLWIRARGREFGVYVYVRFNPQTDALQTVRFKESDR